MGAAPQPKARGPSSYEEFKARNAAERLAKAMEAASVELKNLFLSLDVDGDGKLTSDEWSQGLSANQALFTKFFGGTTIEENASVFRELDVDHSGALSWEEFEAGAKAMLRTPGGGAHT